jgi:DNA-binding response OmpR family regulator
MSPKAHILVADDDFLYRTLFSASLEDAGYEVECVSNGAEALAALEAKPFDLLLLDLLMPELDGFSTLKQLQQRGLLPGLPVLIISATDEADSFVRCMRAGAVDMLPKPFEPTMLLTRVNAALCLKQGARLHQKLHETTDLLSSLLTSGTVSAEHRQSLERALQILSS